MSRLGQGRIDRAGFGLLIDAARPLTFTFDGRLHNGFHGDTLASALLAEGRSVLSRSFKYHRPRGVLTMAGHDANTLVQVAEEPNVRADVHRLSDGLAVRSVNTLGSLDRDLYAGLDKLSRFLPVGFYYKTFFRPAWAWKYFERPIRALAGLGHLEPAARAKYYDKAYLFADVLVAGGGPAGLEVAIAAADAGADTILMDEEREPGGSLLYGRGERGRDMTDATRHALLERARRQPNLRIMPETTVSGIFADTWVSAISGNRLFKVRADHVVVATGAFDQPLVFRNNDRPGIMFADAAQRLMRLYGVRPGTRAVIATTNRFGYEAALDLHDVGIEVAAIVDLNPQPPAASEAARVLGIRIIPGSTIVDAKGVGRVESAGIASITGEGAAANSVEWIACDLVLVSVGYAPALNLACHAGAKARYDTKIHMHRAVDVPHGVSLAGAAAGVWSDDLISASARRAGTRAAALALGRNAEEAEDVFDPAATSITHPYPIFTHPKAKDFVDFDEDVQVKDLVDTVAAGYDDIQLVKRYSTEGFGPSQGRHANLNTIRIVARATGKSLEAIGTTTYRPPLVPEKFGHMAGRAFEPVRRTAMHQRHVELGARMMVAGTWLRPAYYGPKSECERRIAEEVKAVRERVGLIDVSTLGGLDIRGPDAAAFVDRMYTWSHGTQTIGRARYALMCDQTGVVIDDGVACRLHEQHYYVTATTGAIDQVYRTMTWFNVQWKLDVDIANVTSAYAAVNLAGPKARALLQSLGGDIDLSREAFPYMAIRTGTLADIPVRVLRVGYVGELGYEIHAPSGMGEALWDTLMERGQPLGITPFGVEAQRVLRLEKGHLIFGQDTDGLTHPLEAGLDWALAKKKPYYVGKRSIEMLAAKGLSRKLVGFRLTGPRSFVPKECHLVIRDGNIVGRITSVARSPTLGDVIGLAYVPPDLASIGSRFEVRVDGGTLIEAEVARTPFYDPGNARQEV
ncbi:MAG: 2Fe-2S iron-sulfur cluster-binding protein [Hyphomicrobium sp.]